MRCKCVVKQTAVFLAVQGTSQKVHRDLVAGDTVVAGDTDRAQAAVAGHPGPPKAAVADEAEKSDASETTLPLPEGVAGDTEETRSAVADALPPPQNGWAACYMIATEMVHRKEMAGYDETWMKLLPMSVPYAWQDAGPHFTLAVDPPTGAKTSDSNGNTDDVAMAKEIAK